MSGKTEDSFPEKIPGMNGAYVRHWIRASPETEIRVGGKMGKFCGEMSLSHVRGDKGASRLKIPRKTYRNKEYRCRDIQLS